MPKIDITLAPTEVAALAPKHTALEAELLAALRTFPCDCRCSVHNDTLIPNLWESLNHAPLLTEYCKKSCLQAMCGNSKGGGQIEMKYTVRLPEVDAVQAQILDGELAGEICFHVRSANGELTAVVGKEAFLSMYEPVEPEVPWKAAEIIQPAKKAAKKAAAKKAAKKTAKVPVVELEPRTPRPKTEGELTLNEAICQVMDKHDALTTVELAAEVEKIRPGSPLASIYAAVSPCIAKGFIKRRDSDKKLVAA